MLKRFVPRVRTSYAAPAWAAEQRVGGPGIKAVLLLLARYADENYSCFPGQQTLADESEQSRRTVLRQLKDLEAWGLIRRERRVDARGHRTSDRFYLNLDLVVDVNAPDGPDEAATSVSKDLTQEPESLGANLSLRDSAASDSEPKCHQESPRDQDPKCHQESPRTTALCDKSEALGDTDDVSYVTPGVTGTPRGTTTGTTSLDTHANVTALPVTSPDGSGSSTTEDKPAKRRKITATSLPADFVLTEGMRAWAAQSCPTLDVQFEFDSFCDRVAANGVQYVDWNRGWMTHMRNQERWNRERRGLRGGPAGPAQQRRSYDDTATWGAPAPLPDQPALPEDDEDDDLSIFDKSNRKYVQ